MLGHVHDSAGVASTEDASEVTYRGGASEPPGVPGVVEGTPHVYIVYWGSQWGSAGSDSHGDYTFSNDSSNMAPFQQLFFKGLGTDGETWSGVMTQYCDGVSIGATSCPASNSEHVGYPSGGALAGVWYDDSVAAPAAASTSEIEQEAIAAAVHFGNDQSDANLDNQYIITSPPGTDPDNVFSNNECSWHSATINVSWAPDELAYTNMPYIPEQGSTCGAGYVNTPGTLDGVSIVGGHEYAETLTDMTANTFGLGWLDDLGNEVADKCEWGANGSLPLFANVSLATSSSASQPFAMMPMWANDKSNSTGGCELTHPIVTDPPTQANGARILIVGDSISNGNLGDYTWRYRLKQLLSQSGVNAEFVGHRTGTENMYDDPASLATANGTPRPANNYSDPTDGYYNQSMNSACADGACAHDAMWGWTYHQAKGEVAQDVSTYQPDYLLIELGFNDLAFVNSPAGTVADAKTLIDNSRAVDPSVKILVANVVHHTPLCGYPNLDSNIDTYNADLAAAVPGWSTASSPVHLVDISSGYDPTIGVDSYDGVHPDGEGEYEIADAFASALADDYGVGADPGTPPASVPGISMTTPTSMSASLSATGVLLQWSHVYGATGYKIFERDITGNPNPLPAFSELPIPLPSDHWQAGWGQPGHTYQYAVAAARGADESAASSPATVTMPASEPTADPPSDVTATPGATSITLNWTPPSGGNDSGITGYTVYWLDSDNACGNQIPSTAEATDTSYTITGLTPGHTYDLAIASTSAAGTGAWGGAPAVIVGDGAPAAPVLSAASSVQLSWTDVPGATGYWIYETDSLSPGVSPTWTRLPLELPAGWNGTLAAGAYAVTAANGSLESPMSNIIVLEGAPAGTLPSSGDQATGIPGAINPTAWIPSWLNAAPNEALMQELSLHA